MRSWDDCQLDNEMRRRPNTYDIGYVISRIYFISYTIEVEGPLNDKTRRLPNKREVFTAPNTMIR